MKAAEMEKGQTIKVEGKLYTIIDFEHVKLGKGGAVYQTKLKGIADGLIQNIRVRSEEILEEVELEKKKLEIEAVTYLRGRTLPNQYIIIDDAQNLTPHEIKTIISRVGEGSKNVLTGDPYRIDNYYLDAASNGLTNLVERFKKQVVFGHVTFTKSERSVLAALASDLL